MHLMVQNNMKNWRPPGLQITMMTLSKATVQRRQVKPRILMPQMTLTMKMGQRQMAQRKTTTKMKVKIAKTR